jgi:hypothetical protein
VGPRLLAALTAASFQLCGPPGPPAPPSPPDSRVLECKEAGMRLRELGCAEGYTPDGALFEDACAHAAADGVDWRPDCIARIAACDAVTVAYETPEGEPCP